MTCLPQSCSVLYYLYYSEIQYPVSFTITQAELYNFEVLAGTHSPRAAASNKHCCTRRSVYYAGTHDQKLHRVTGDREYFKATSYRWGPVDIQR